MVSVYDLAFNYIERFFNHEPSKQKKIEIIKQFHIILNLGWTAEAIVKKLNSISANEIEPNIKDLFPFYTGEDRNLLKCGDQFFYYHNLLRICPPPPTTVWDIDSGEIKTVSEDYYLEMRASINAQQITEYYLTQMDIPKETINFNRYNGSFLYMIEKHGVDKVLFMVDVAKNYIFSDGHPKPTSPVGVGEYLTEAEELLNHKIRENKATGDDKIVHRKRVLSIRSRGEEARVLHQEYINYA